MITYKYDVEKSEITYIAYMLYLSEDRYINSLHTKEINLL